HNREVDRDDAEQRQWNQRQTPENIGKQGFTGSTSFRYRSSHRPCCSFRCCRAQIMVPASPLCQATLIFT
ncbi:MAG TPA: hypothetical protein PL000_22930, partial [Anaerolineales bacterium]|nr:hypothetical protein [Anaerolineales bacterium]